jgi:hypothetical protein
MHLLVPSFLVPKGRVIIRGYRAGAIEAVQPLLGKLNEWKEELHNHTGHPHRQIEQIIANLVKQIEGVFSRYSLGIESITENLIMTGSLTGRDLLVQYLTGNTVYTGGLNYGSLGTGSTTPAAGDTQLTAEVARTVPSIANDLSNNQAQFQFYFPDANLANNTYREAGSFMNATATLNSGKIFNHALLGTPFVKTTGVDVTLEIDISLI